MQWYTDYTHQNVKETKFQQSFWFKRKSQIEIDQEELKIDSPAKIAKWGTIAIPVPYLMLPTKTTVTLSNSEGIRQRLFLFSPKLH